MVLPLPLPLLDRRIDFRGGVVRCVGLLAERLGMGRNVDDGALP